jgi:hypothetical protein
LAPAGTVTVAGVKLSEAETRTVVDAVPNPGAEIETVAEPSFAPVITGAFTGWVCPTGMEITDGATVTRDASLLDRVTDTPPAGAGADNATNSGID